MDSTKRRAAGILARASGELDELQIDPEDEEADGNQWALLWARGALDGGLADLLERKPTADELAELLVEASDAHESAAVEGSLTDFAARLVVDGFGARSG